MAKIADVQEVSLEKLRPYERNAKKHGPDQVEKLKASILEFGFLTPCLIDSNYNLIAGHGRVMAAKDLGFESVPCVFIEGLTDEQRRAYILADNRLGELGEWNWDIIDSELRELDKMDFIIELAGFEMPDTDDWFENRDRGNTNRQEGNDEYNEFLDKFEIKKTTDDCYTPDNVYDAIADWVSEFYKVDRSNFVRPFYPNGDYQAEKYKESDIVVDNPPFSILSEIINFYCSHKIRFFLFAPYLTMFGSGRDCDVCYLPANISVTYENGACVNTGFITNLDNAKIRSVPTLYAKAQVAADEYRKELKRELPKYSYPNEVVMATNVGKFSRYGIDFVVYSEECTRVSQLDAQKETDKAMYGGGFFISNKKAAEKAAAEKAAAEKAAAEKAAAEKAAAEKAAATVWKLSERERKIIDSLGKEDQTNG